jgi:hypothetical protein
MNDEELITAVRESFSGVHSATPVEQIVGRSRGLRVRRQVPRLISALAVAAGAAAAVAALLPASHQVNSGGPARLAAWTVQRDPGGTIKVTIRELRDAAGLQARLRADGVPANVVFLHHSFTPTTSTSAIPRSCRAPHISDKTNARLQDRIMPFPGPAALGPNSVVLVINPSAIPARIGLFIEAFAASPGTTTGDVFSLQTNLVQASLPCTGS